MARLLRTFVALCSGPAACRRFAREARRLAALDDGFRAPATDDFHLTLQFLGDTNETDVPAIARALVRAAEGHEPLSLRYGGLGAFPEPARARVVWAAVGAETAGGEADPAPLVALARSVGEALRPLGFPTEGRAWHPHVTLGRLRRRPAPALVEALLAGAALDLGGEEVSDLKLILSDPGEGRYRYIDLTTVPLG
jgi:2'-5' RNA ligase